MKIITFIIGIFLALCIGWQAQADERIRVYLYNGDRPVRHHTGPVFEDKEPSKCFPYGCGGIIGPFTNPDPNARKPENLTSCIYDSSNKLMYERVGKICPNSYVDQNEVRMKLRE